MMMIVTMMIVMPGKTSAAGSPHSPTLAPARCWQGRGEYSSKTSEEKCFFEQKIAAILGSARNLKYSSNYFCSVKTPLFYPNHCGGIFTPVARCLTHEAVADLKLLQRTTLKNNAKMDLRKCQTSDEIKRVLEFATNLQHAKQFLSSKHQTYPSSAILRLG